MTISNSRELGKTTEAAVKALEEEIAAELVPDYRAFLLEHNGGYPEPATFVVADTGDVLTLETFFGLHEEPKHMSLRAHLIEWGASLLPDLLPVGYEQGGNPVCLVLRGDRRGEVCLWDEQLDQAVGADSVRSLYHLADSFGQFLAELGLPDE